MTLKAIRKLRCNIFDGDARSIRGNNRGLFADCINAFHQILFDFKIFDNRLNDNIGFGDDIKIIFEVADFDQFVLVAREERCWARLFCRH